MKRLILYSSLALLSLTGPSLAQTLKPHEFFNADRTQSFKATLMDYDPTTQVVSARPVGSSIMNFKMEVLSKEDQEYVLKKATTALLGNKINVNIEEWTGDSETAKRGAVRSSKTESAYDITFTPSKDIIITTDLTMDYVIFIRRGQEKGPSKTEEVHGSASLRGLLDSSTYTVRTKTVETERYRRESSGGG